MKCFQLGRRGLLIGNTEVKLLIVKEFPELPEKFEYPFNSVGVPWFALLQRTQKHLVHTKRVGSISLDDIVRTYHIELRFGHFFNLMPAMVFAILQNELRIRVF